MNNTNTIQHTQPENTVPSDQQMPHHQSLSASPASEMDVAITERAIANLLLKKRIKGAMVDIHITLDDYLKECEKVWDRTVTPGTKILYQSTIKYHILPFFTGTRIINWDRPCVFRPKPATDSDASRPPIPTERGH